MDLIGRSARKPGSVICGKWRIEALLRATSNSATYSAIHRNGARVALKILHAHLSTDKTLQARFRREAYVANTIPHPDTVKVIDDDETDDGCAVLVMDHFDGETLEELRNRKGGKIGLEVASAFMDQLLDIIASAHDQGMVHRDIKGETVFVTKEGRVKVHDFGTARVLSETSAPAEMTAAGMVIGSPSSMAPEQARGQRDMVDAQSDIFSLGALFFTLVSGEPVHKIANPLAALVAAAKTRAPSLRTVVSAYEVSDAVVEAVDRALAFQKADRWPDVRAFRAALRAARGELIDTFPQPGRRDPLADLMAEETTENSILLVDDDVPLMPVADARRAPAQPPPAPPPSSARQAPPLPNAGVGAARPSAPRLPTAPSAAVPPRLPSAQNAQSAPPRMAARVMSGPERRAAERAGQAVPAPPQAPPPQAPPPQARPNWQDEEDHDDDATLAQSELDPELMAALADLRKDAVPIAPTKAVPRVGGRNDGPPRPGGTRPSVIPRPGPRSEAPPPPSEPPTAIALPSAPRSAPQAAPRLNARGHEGRADARDPALAPTSYPPPSRGPEPAFSLPNDPRSPSTLKLAPEPPPAPSGDPRFATVMMAGSPALPPQLPPPSQQGLAMSGPRPVFQAEVVMDERQRASSAASLAPFVPPPPSPQAPPGFAYHPPPAFAPHPSQGFPGGPNMGHVARPTPFEVFEPAPPAPYTAPPFHVPTGEYPGRRLSTHEDLRILVPEQSYSLDHNPFADAARRRKRITIGVVVAIVAIVLVALIAMLRSG